MLNNGAVNRVLFLSPCHHHFPFIRAQPSKKFCQISLQCPPSNTIRAMKKGPSGCLGYMFGMKYYPAMPF